MNSHKVTEKKIVHRANTPEAKKIWDMVEHAASFAPDWVKDQVEKNQIKEDNEQSPDTAEYIRVPSPVTIENSRYFEDITQRLDFTDLFNTILEKPSRYEVFCWDDLNGSPMWWSFGRHDPEVYREAIMRVDGETTGIPCEEYCFGACVHTFWKFTVDAHGRNQCEVVTSDTPGAMSVTVLYAC